MNEKIKSIFTESTFGQGDNNIKTTIVQLDKYIDRLSLDKRQQQSNSLFHSIIESLIHPLKLYLCFKSASTKGSQIDLTCKFYSKYILNLSTIVSASTPPTSAATTLKSKIRNELLSFTLNVTESKENIVRLRSLQLINQILIDTDNVAELFNNGYNHFIKLIIQRSRDKNSNIRSLAINILIRFCLLTKDKDVMEELLSLLNQDSFSGTRQLILSNLLKLESILDYNNKQVILETIVTRTKDVKESIRVCAYKTLKEYIKLDDLSSTDEMIAILKSGFSDSEELVQKETADLLFNWFDQFKGDHNFYYLLELVDVETNQDLLVDWLEKMDKFNIQIPTFNNFNSNNSSKHNNINNNNHDDDDDNENDNQQSSSTVTTDNEEQQQKTMTNEESFHFRITISLLQKKIDKSKSNYTERLLYQDQFDEVFPSTLTDFRDILFAHISEPFVMKQLLTVLSIIDSNGDEVGRNNLIIFLIELIKKMSPDQQELLELALKSVSRFYNLERDFIISMVEILQDMIDPLEEDELSKRLAIFKRNLKRLGSKSPTEATKIANAIGTLEKEIKERDNDILLKSSFISHYLLLKSKKCTNEIDTLLELIILPSIQHKNPKIRSFGIQNLGIYCLHRKDIVNDYLNLFSTALDNDIHEVQVKALKVIFDILLVYGSPNNIPKEMVPLYNQTRKFIHHSNEIDIKMICIEGFVKLIFSGITKDRKIIVFLFLEMFSHSTKDLGEIRKCLHLFFEQFTQDSIENKQILFDESIHILQMITQAITNSSYSNISVLEVGKLLFSLFDRPVSNTKKSSTSTSTFKEEDIHPNLAKMIIQELISCFRGETKELTKLLPMFRFDKENHLSHLLELKELFQRLAVAYSDQYTDRFQQILDNSLPTMHQSTYLSQHKSSIPSSLFSLDNNNNNKNSKSNSSKNEKLPTSSQLSTKSSSNGNKKLPFDLEVMKSFFEKQKQYLNTTEFIDKTVIIKETPTKKQKISYSIKKNDNTVNNSNNNNSNIKSNSNFNNNILIKPDNNNTNNISTTLDNHNSSTKVIKIDDLNINNLNSPNNNNDSNPIVLDLKLNILTVDDVNNNNINNSNSNNNNNNNNHSNNNNNNNVNNVNNNLKSILKKRSNDEIEKQHKKVRFN